MTVRAIVVDTSCLLELYRVPGHHDPAFGEMLKKRWEVAVRSGDRFYVPSAVLFEVANHIAHAREHRFSLAARFAEDARMSARDGQPWIVTSATEREPDVVLRLSELLVLCDKFATQYAVQEIGLSDAAIIDQAHRLKSSSTVLSSVHIWTTDGALKSHEPDQEEDPLES